MGEDGIVGEDRHQGDGQESWRTPAAVHSRSRLGWSIVVFIALMFVLPVVAKFFHWF